MVIDTSVLIAIVLGEACRPRLLAALEEKAERLMSAVSLLEAGMILRARVGVRALAPFRQIVDELVSEIVPFDEIQARLAIKALARFGRGMGHPAQLNFGDCAVYALAESRGQAVLAVGNDFAATDLDCCPF